MRAILLWVVNMGKFKDITGQRFGRLTVLYQLHNTKGRTKWLCICECGNLVEVITNSLRQGLTKSCGCLNREIVTKHGKSNTKMYNAWRHITQRCYNENCKAYKHYGARGITMCDEWKDSFQAFYDWSMANGYADNLTIDRIDNNKGYEPSNCRWITMKQQERNKRNNRQFTYNGETHCITEWCEMLGINYGTFKSRFYKYGWPIEKALELEGKL